MKNIFYKKVLVALALIGVLLPSLLVSLSHANAAGESDKLLWGSTQDTVGTNLDMQGSKGKDPRAVIAKFINILLGFLGIIAVALIVLAGFRWMTAGGDSSKVEEAQSLMKNAVIGLIIVLSAYALAVYVTDTLYREINK